MTQTKEKIAPPSDQIVSITVYDAHDYYNPNVEVKGGRDKTLGHDVVRLHGELVGMELNGADASALQATQLHYDDALQELRNNMTSLDAFERLHFNTMFTKNPIQSRWLADTIGIDIDDSKPHDYIEALAAADDKVFTNAMELYQANVAKLQQELERQRTGVVNDLLDAMQQGIENGWLAESLDLSEVRTRLSQVELRQDDGSHTLLLPLAWEGYQYHDFDRDQSVVVMSPEHLSEGSEEQRRMTLFHEFMHAASYDNGAGLLETLHLSEFGSSVINEAVTQHLAQSFYMSSQASKTTNLVDRATLESRADVDVISPSDKDSAITTMAYYPQERQLLNMLCNKGESSVDVGLFIDAYFDGNAAPRLCVELTHAFPGQDVYVRLKTLQNPQDVAQLIYDLQTYEPEAQTESHHKLLRKIGRGALGKVHSHLHELSTTLTMR